MATISAFRVKQNSQSFSFFFRNRIQCIALYQLYNSQALLNLPRGYYRLYLSASCGGMCLNWVYRLPSQLSVPEVPTTVPPKLQPYWLKI